MEKISLSILLLTVHAAVSAAAIYECTDASGRKVYTQDGGRNCRSSCLGQPSVYTSAPVYTVPQMSQQNNAEPQVQESAEVVAARQALHQAQLALEEGRKVRYGNERNYVKYMERIQGLENQVKAAEQKLNAAKSGYPAAAANQ